MNLRREALCLHLLRLFHNDINLITHAHNAELDTPLLPDSCADCAVRMNNALLACAVGDIEWLKRSLSPRSNLSATNREV